MRLVGFNFKKINIEKLSDSFKEVKINSKINISNIEVLKTEALQEKEGVIQINFTYHVDYNPDIAKIELGGRVLLVTNKEQTIEIEEMWKNKKMSEEFRISLFNIILRKANIKALELEEEINLPLHIPLPTLKKPKKE
jgi:hypothetical protein